MKKNKNNNGSKSYQKDKKSTAKNINNYSKKPMWTRLVVIVLIATMLIFTVITAGLALVG